MANKIVLSVGYRFPGDAVENILVYDNRSLLDADLVIFSAPPRYFEVTDDVIEHWTKELEDVLQDGKNIFVFLTGRGADTEMYEALPSGLQAHERTGQRISATRDLGPFASYWQEFQDISEYHLTLEGRFDRVLFTTRSKHAVVGGMIRRGAGWLVLLPPIRLADIDGLYDDDDEWGPEAEKFGKRLLSSLFHIDKSLRSEGEATAMPDWASAYELPREAGILEQIASCNQQMRELAERRAQLEIELQDAGSLRRLLYESGKPLESAVCEALKIMGFEAAHYQLGGSEFDVLFSSEDGRFLGECEGKDNRQIHVEKLSQLIRNLHEDLAREEITSPAIGVLFGNAERLSPLEKRGDAPFTAKCILSARQSSIVLVHTPDLFAPARYLLHSNDVGYARECRRAIFDAQGKRVSFPQPPI